MLARSLPIPFIEGRKYRPHNVGFRKAGIQLKRAGEGGQGRRGSVARAHRQVKNLKVGSLREANVWWSVVRIELNCALEAFERAIHPQRGHLVQVVAAL